MTIRVVARERLLPEHRQEAMEVFARLIENTRTEKGNIAYNLHESIDDPCVVAMIEVWESPEALDAHLHGESFQSLIQLVEPFKAEPSRIEVYKEIM